MGQKITYSELIYMKYYVIHYNYADEEHLLLADLIF